MAEIGGQLCSQINQAPKEQPVQSSTPSTEGPPQRRDNYQKVRKLHARRFGPNLDTEKVVRNLSHRTLTEDEKRVLALGLNFAVTPKTIPVPDVIAATEATARQADPDTAERLRWGSALFSDQPSLQRATCLVVYAEH